MICDHCEVLFLIRHIKPSHIQNNEITDEAFQLREDRMPPEEYVSFFHSRLDSVEDKIRDVKNEFKKRNYTIKKNCGFIHLNASKASEEVNIIKEIIKFKEEGYPHYGMYYISDDEIDIIEAKSILIHHSELYMNSNCASVLEQNKA